MSTNKQILLNQQIETIPFTEELKKILASGNIHTLKDLLNMEVYNWHKKLSGFNYHHQHEVVSWLQKQDLMEFLKED